MVWQTVVEIYEMVKNAARDENANSNVKKAFFLNEIRDIRIVLN